MENSIAIIGSGIAGTLAFHALKKFTPVCIDPRSKPSDGILGLHPAVMRLRDNKVAELIDADYKEIIVSKGVWVGGVEDGKLVGVSDLRLNNLYSQKLYGEIGRRSLLSIKEESRFLLTDGYPAPDNAIWDSYVESVSNGVIRIRNRLTGKLFEAKYKYIISTIPIPVLNSIVSPSIPDFSEDQFQSNKVDVLRGRLSISSSVHQTIYFPELDTPIYRITVQNQDIIVEANAPDFRVKKLISVSFGIPEKFIDLNDQWDEMRIGKIKKADEDTRLRSIMWLTDYHGIFSFGRHAVWKPLRTDHLIQDIEKIKRIISANKIETIYKNRF